MSKWTPGPWYHLAGLHVSTTVGPDWSAADKYIAQVERPYDARLIAAAPEMIEALKEAIGHVQEYGEGCLYCGYDEDYVAKHGETSEAHKAECWYYKAEALIKKAEGKS